MKILMVGPMHYKVEPNSIGSIENVMGMIISGLNKEPDIEVTLIGAGDSIRTTKNIVIIEKSPGIYNVDQTEQINEVIQYVKDHANEYDIIHSHFPIITTSKMVTDHKTPIMKTLHGAVIKQGDPAATALRIKAAKEIDYIVPIAGHLAKECSELNYTKIAYNGIDIDKFSYNPNPTGDYWMCLGRVTETKGTRYAVEAALRCNKKLFIAGQVVTEEDQEYFNTYVKPYLGDNIQYLGTLGEEKYSYIQNAKLLIMASCWEEAFSLVLLESMACGTPVVGTRRGCLPEVITEGYNGYLVSSSGFTLDVDDLCEKALLTEKINRKNCRNSVAGRFNIEAMVAAYKAIYEDILS